MIMRVRRCSCSPYDPKFSGFGGFHVRPAGGIRWPQGACILYYIFSGPNRCVLNRVLSWPSAPKHTVEYMNLGVSHNRSHLPDYRLLNPKCQAPRLSCFIPPFLFPHSSNATGNVFSVGNLHFSLYAFYEDTTLYANYHRRYVRT